MAERRIMFGGVVMGNAVAVGDPYIEPPTIPAGTTLPAYRLARPRRRSLWQRLVRRLNGH